MKTWHSIIFVCLVSMFVGCSSKSPTDNLVNPTSESALNHWNTSWIVYDDEIKTGGTVQRYTTQEGQSVDFNCFDNDTASDPYGKRCIKYSWDGGAVGQYDSTGKVIATSATWCGFGLIVAKDYESTSKTKDVSQGGYTKLSFSFKGQLSTDTWLVIGGPDGPSTGDTTVLPDKFSIGKDEITNTWQQKTVTLTSKSLGKLSAMTTFVSINFEYRRGMDTQGSGGTVYIDNVELHQ